MNADIKPPLLQYTVSTDPTPVNISTDSDPVTAKILVTVKANPKVNCKRIQIVVNIGDGETDMYRKDPAPIISPTPPLPSDWAPSTIIPPDVFNNSENTKVFTFTHTSEDKAVTKDVTFCVSGTVNNTSGVSTIQIYESSTLITDNNYMTRQQPENVTKAAEETFFLKNIRAAYTGSPTEFITVFEKNQPLQLLWESNADHYRVFSGKDPKPIMSGGNKFYNISGLENDTTYIIEATKGDKTLYQQYVVNINNPKKSFSEVTVSDKCDIRNSIVYSLGTMKSLPGQGVIEADGFIIVDAIMEKRSMASYGYMMISIDGKKHGISLITQPGLDSFGTITIPVKKGAQYGNERFTTYGPIIDFNISFLPIGKTAPTAIENAIDESDTQIHIAEDILIPEDINRRKAAQFIDALEIAFEKSLTGDVKNKLIETYLQ